MSIKNIEKYLISKPAYEVTPDFEVEGRLSPAMTMLSNNLIADSNNYVEIGWIVGMPDPNPHIGEHVHEYDEIVMHIGIDPNDHEDLGAEIIFYLDGQPLTINRTSTVFVPKGVKHGPLIWKSYHRPHLEMTVMLGAGSLMEADPGGHKAREGKK